MNINFLLKTHTYPVTEIKTTIKLNHILDSFALHIMVIPMTMMIYLQVMDIIRKSFYGAIHPFQS